MDRYSEVVIGEIPWVEIDLVGSHYFLWHGSGCEIITNNYYRQIIDAKGYTITELYDFLKKEWAIYEVFKSK
jgi:hypothetical protein